MITTLLIIGSLAVGSPDTLELADCYHRLQEQFPLNDKARLEERIAELKKQNLQTEYYPQLHLNARASYKSPVTEFTFTPPGMQVPEFHHDQYSAELTASQLVYGGGRIEIGQQQAEQRSKMNQAKVEVQLRDLRETVDQLYFRILQIQKNAAILRKNRQKIAARRSVVRAKVQHGTLLPTNLHILEAELTEIDQQLIQLKNGRQAARQALAKLLDFSIDSTTVFVLPDLPGQVKKEMQASRRPEYQVLKQQKKLLQIQEEQVRAERKPHLSAFATAGYGRPGLDRFDPSFDTYYMLGLSLQWSLWDIINADRRIDRLDFQQQQVEAERKTLTRKMRSEIEHLLQQIQKYKQLSATDQKIINQRKEILRQRKSQLANGVITSSDYLKALYEVQQAQLKRELHKLELLFTRVRLRTQINASWNK